jgi:hypothetical protein
MLFDFVFHLVMHQKNTRNMIRNLTASLILIACIIGHAGTSHAQGTINLDEIKVVAPYVPTISDAFKINTSPKIDDTLSISMEFDYRITPRRMDARFIPEALSPVRLRSEPLGRMNRGMLKGGYGNYNTPYFEGFYNSLRSTRYAFGAHLKHLSSTGKIEDYGYSGYSDNMAMIYGARYFRNTNIDARLQYDRQVVHKYGFVTDGEYYMLFDRLPPHVPPPPPRDSIRQQFDILSSHIGFGSHRPDSSRLYHNARIAHTYLSDNYDVTEHQFSLTGTLGFPIGEDPFGWALSQYLSIDYRGILYDNQWSRYSDTKRTNGIVSLVPKISSGFRQLNFYLGVNASVEADTTSYLRVYPLAGITATIIPQRLIVFADLSGELKKHSIYSLSRENPYMHTLLSMLRYENTRSRVGGGIRGSISRFLSYEFSLYNSVIDNYAFFVNFNNLGVSDEGIIPFHNSVTYYNTYDDIRRLHLHGGLQFQAGKSFRAAVSADYYQYGLNTLLEAWHTPMFTSSLNMQYTFREKMILSADLFARDAIMGERLNPGSLTFEAYTFQDFHLDVNFGAEYRYTRNLSVFASFNNVTNQPFERWMFTPSQGFNFLGGISYSF